MIEIMTAGGWKELKESDAGKRAKLISKPEVAPFWGHAGTFKLDLKEESKILGCFKAGCQTPDGEPKERVDHTYCVSHSRISKDKWTYPDREELKK
jgi:hypothetical protein